MTARLAPSRTDFLDRPELRMTDDAIVHLHDADPHPEAVECMERITSTFESTWS
ncbi:hypothetical protein NOCA1170042 [metagenome]|uniref:Uncharacterized protein n=1 Tax=metagenome TaxID=256318 RepID=A0A2P2CAN4_9ZZZZ